jgi:hypothetical protein
MEQTDFSTLARTLAVGAPRRQVVLGLAWLFGSALGLGSRKARAQDVGCDYRKFTQSEYFDHRAYDRSVTTCNLSAINALKPATENSEVSLAPLGQAFACLFNASETFDDNRLKAQSSLCSGVNPDTGPPTYVCVADPARGDGLGGTCCPIGKHAVGGNCTNCPSCSDDLYSGGDCKPCGNCKRCVGGMCTYTHDGHTWLPKPDGGCCIAGWDRCLLNGGAFFCCEAERGCNSQGTGCNPFP